MKLKSLFTFITLCLAFTIFAQDNFQGEATYMSKTTVDTNGWGGKEMSPEQKKMIMKRMKSMLEKTFILTFNKSESMYKEEERLETPGKGLGMMMRMGMGSGLQYKDIKAGVLLEEKDFMGKKFLIKDELKKLEWKITGETKQIGKYMCMKAVAVKPIDQTDWTKMRQKNRNKVEKKDSEKKKKDRTVNAFGKAETKQNIKAKDSSTETIKITMDDIEIPKEEEVVAWYTMQIPVNNGPSDFWGLPGLILEINSGRTTILCSKIVMNPAEKKGINKPTKGEEITRDKYAEIVTKKMTEMREMYGRRNRGSRRK